MAAETNRATRIAIFPGFDFGVPLDVGAVAV